MSTATTTVVPTEENVISHTTKIAPLNNIKTELQDETSEKSMEIATNSETVNACEQTSEITLINESKNVDTRSHTPEISQEIKVKIEPGYEENSNTNIVIAKPKESDELNSAENIRVDAGSHTPEPVKSIKIEPLQSNKENLNGPEQSTNQQVSSLNDEKETKPLIKSSDEILSELFSSFNAKPPSLNDSNSDHESVHKKSKKSKKKHKKKHKKHKKLNDEKSKKKSKRKKRSSSEMDGVKEENGKKIKVEDIGSSIINFETVCNVISDELKSTVDILEKDHQLENGDKKEHGKHEKPKITIQNLLTTSITKEKPTTADEGECDSSDLNLEQSTDEENYSRKHKRKHRSSSKEPKTKSSHRHKRNSSSKSKSKNRSRERSRSNDRRRSSSRSKRSVKDRLGYRDDDHRKYPSRYHYDDFYGRRRLRDSRSSSPHSRFDKKKLLEIARKNAITMLKSGSIPGAVTLGPQAQEKVIAAIKAGGKSIEELTDFCKNLSRKEALGELSSISSGEDGDSGSDNERAFNHPFQLKERPSSIVMNIPNSTALPLKSSMDKTVDKNSLLLQFPVSSGQHHRKTESEWIPVPPKKTETTTAVKSTPAKATITLTEQLTTLSATIPDKPLIPTPVIPTPTPQPVPVSQVFPTMESNENLDISAIVSQRLLALRKLQENPNDVQAIGQIYRSQQKMQTWATSKQSTGQFTGSTGAQILTPAELASGYQAWARKDQLQTAAPVSGGMGMHLLQKMGWRPGEGLGKEKNGALQPLLLEVKLDKKGLVTNEEVPTKHGQPAVKKLPVKTLEGKHPVSLLGEYATKRKMDPPQYDLCFECGPSHKKNFLFKVRLNGIEYQPSVASPNKKQAKADAATVCLQQLGLLPS